MKKSNVLKLSALAFTLTLTAGVFAFTRSTQSTAADETPPTSEILGQNLSLQDNIYILYAVDFQNTLETDETGLLVWDAPQENYVYETANAVLSAIDSLFKSGETYPTFSYNELAAKQMTETVYASAYVERDGEYYYSDVKKYSILEYAYNKLGKTEAEPTTNENLKTLLNSMLTYGAATQTYLGYNTDNLATDNYTYVRVENGAFADGFDYGLYKAGMQVLLTPNDGYELYSPTPNYITVNENGEILLTVPQDKLIVEDLFVEIPKYSDGLEFTLLDNDTYSVSKGTCTDRNVIIPATYNGKPVTEIADDAFAAYNLFQIEIPDSVTCIGSNAFNYILHSFYYITLPKNLTYIGDSAFQNCRVLREIIIPLSVEYIGTSAFAMCDNLTLYYEATTKWQHWGNMGSRPEYYYSENEPALNSDGTAYNGKYWRYVDGKIDIWDENDLYSQGLEYTLLDDDTYAVSGIGTCTDENLIIPAIYEGKAVTKIADYAFYIEETRGCKTLVSVVIPDSVTIIGGYAFQGCTNLVSVTLPNSIKEIYHEAFLGCTSLTNINIPNTVTYIGQGAFANCLSLETIVIPVSVTTMLNETFHWCENLTIYCEAESQPESWLPDWNSTNCPVVWGYTTEE